LGVNPFSDTFLNYPYVKDSAGNTMLIGEFDFHLREFFPSGAGFDFSSWQNGQLILNCLGGGQMGLPPRSITRCRNGRTNERIGSGVPLLLPWPISEPIRRLIVAGLLPSATDTARGSVSLGWGRTCDVCDRGRS
jgi:hypothetical protein